MKDKIKENDFKLLEFIQSNPKCTLHDIESGCKRVVAVDERITYLEKQNYISNNAILVEYGSETEVKYATTDEGDIAIQDWITEKHLAFKYFIYKSVMTPIVVTLLTLLLSELLKQLLLRVL
jgi:hypothetical protein